jgi:uncharacterized membrane protein YqaE (UPF0057 family)
MGLWFWIAVLLTILGWLPGVIFALAMQFRPPAEPGFAT